MKMFTKKNSFISTVLTIIVGLIIIGGALWFAYGRTTSVPKNNSTPKTLDGQIELLSSAIKANPQEVKNYIGLSQAYLQKVRETADISYYQKINELMDKAEKISPTNSDIPSTRGSVEIGRHHFKEGKAYAEKAIALNPNNHLYYGLLGDAEIELGQYTEAVDAFQKMVDLRPAYTSYIRIAYIRELYGDIDGAKKFLHLAIDSGSSFKENLAFAYVELGKLDMRKDLQKGKEDFNNALKIVADYPPALEGLGKTAYFEKDFSKSQDYFERAYNKLPIVQYASDLADLQLGQNKNVEANQFLTLAQLAFNKSSSSGVNTDLEESLFLSDHDLDLGKALSKSERAHNERPSVYASDYLAWALYKNNQSDKAGAYTKEAFKLGETDPLILFHQGMIAYKNGNKSNAKKYLSEALKINPYFSIQQAKIAADTLKSLK